MNQKESVPHPRIIVMVNRKKKKKRRRKDPKRTKTDLVMREMQVVILQ
jgi:hypothetical protein